MIGLRIRSAALLWFALALAPVGAAVAGDVLPTGGTVAAGAAQIGAPVNGSLAIQQSSQRAIVNWNQFSVGAQNSVVFQQPNASAAILNRVTGSTPSTIAGAIRANGQVYLINPNGIAITPSGIVDTRGGFVASTLGIADDDFLAGRNRFIGNGASKPVVNSGTIRTGMGGYVALVGGSVQNEGTILAPLGKVGLGSGETATVDLFGDNFLSVALPTNATAADGTPLKSLVSNSGKITANGGRVEIKAATVRQAFREAVNMSGTIQARSVGGRNGAIVLGGGAGGHVKVGGKINASGRSARSGGRIDISGADVSITGSLDVSAGQGGTIVVDAGGRLSIVGEMKARGSAGNGGAIAIVAKDGASLAPSADLDVSGSGNGGTIRIGGGADLSVAGRLAANGLTEGGGIDLSATLTQLTGATVEAKGGQRGGLVRVGGAFRGGHLQNPSDPDEQLYVGRFGALAAIANADTTVIGASTLIDVSSGKTGGTAVVWSERETQQLGRILATGGVTGGAVEISSAGNISQLALGAVRLGKGGRLLLDPTFISVNDLSVNEDPGTGTVLNGVDIEDLIRGGTDVTLSASNDIVWRDGTTRQSGDPSTWADQFGTLTMTAGGSIYLWGEFDFSHGATSGQPGIVDGNLVIVVNDRNATVRTGLSADGRDPTVTAWFYQSQSNNQTQSLNLGNGSLSITVDKGPADILYPYRDPAAGGYGIPSGGSDVDTAVQSAGGIYLEWGTINAASVTMRAYAADSAYVANPSLGGSDRPQIQFGESAFFMVAGGISVVTTGAQSYTGALKLYNDVTLRSTGSTVTWTDETTNSITGSDSQKTIKFVEGSTTTRSGLIFGRTDAVRIALGPGGDVTRDSSDPPAASLHVVDASIHGDLKNGDTLDSIGGSSVTVTGNPSPDPGDTGTVTFSLSSAFSPSTRGYFFDTRTQSVSVTTRALLVALGYTVESPTYNYFSPLSAVTLTGLSAGSAVFPTVSFNGTTVTLQAGASTGQYVFPATVDPGNYGYTLTGITGADAGAYQFTLGAGTSGTLTVTRIPLTYTVSSPTYTYGSPASAITLSGLVSGVEALPTASIGGSPVALAAGAAAGQFTLPGNLNAGTHSYTAGLTGAGADKYEVTFSPGNTGTVTVTPKQLTYQVNSVHSTYGDAPTVVQFFGLLPGDDVAGVIDLGGSQVQLNSTSTAGISTLPARTAARPQTGFTLIGFVSAGASWQADNYSIDLSSGGASGTVTIDKRVLSYTSLNGGAQINISSLPYGSSALSSLSLDFGNVVFGDTVTSVGAQIFDGGSNLVTRTNGPTVGSYTVAAAGLSGADAANYVLPAAGRPLTITQRQIQYSALDGSYVYGQSAQSPITSPGFLAGDEARLQTMICTPAPCTGSSVYGVTTAVGTYQGTVGSLVGADAGNYAVVGALNATSATIHVTPKQLFVTNPDQTYTYGDVAPQSGPVTLSGIINGDDVGAGVNPGFGAGWDPHAGTYAVGTTLTGANAANYTFAGAAPRSGWTVTVQPRALTYTLSSQTFVYGDAVADTVAVLNGLRAGDAGSVHPVIDLAGQGQLAARTVPGSYTAQASGLTFDDAALAGDYVLSSPGAASTTVIVTPRPLTFATADVTTTYRVATGAFGASVTGVLSGDDVQGAAQASASGVTLFGAYTTQDAGTYSIAVTSLTGAQASRYVIASAGNTSGTLTVNPAPLTYSQASQQYTYGDTGPVTGPSLSGLYPGDSASVVWGIFSQGSGTAMAGYASLLGDVSVGPTSPAGTYNLSPVGLVGANAGNYQFASSGNSPGTLIIERRPVNVLPFSQSTYGTFVGSAALFNVVPGDDVSPVATVAANGVISALGARTPAGVYTLTASGLTGAAASNYVLGNTTGQLTVQQKPITVSIDPTTSVYGTLAVLNQATTLDVLPGDDVRLTSSLTNAVLDARLSAGSYGVVVTASGADLGNYFVQGLPTSTLTVERKPFTYVVANAQSVYGEPLPFGAITFSGVLSGDTVVVSPITTDGGGNTVSGRIGVGGYIQKLVPGSGADLSNYVLDQAGSTPGTLTITPRPIVVNLAVAGADADHGLSNPVEYGLIGTSPTFTASSTALFGDSVGVNVTQPMYARSSSGNVAVGTHPIGIALNGADAGNYTIDVAQSHNTLTVVPRQVVATYGVNPVTGITYGDAFVPHISALTGDDVSVSALVDTANGPTAVGSRLAAGTYDWIGPSLSGADAANYRVVDGFNGANFELKVWQRPLVVDFTGDTSTIYGTKANYSNVSFSGWSQDPNVQPVGVLPGDDVTGVVRTLSAPITDRLDAGSYTLTVSLAGTGAANYSIITRTNTTPTALVVTPKPLTLTSSDVNYVYGDTVPRSATVGLSGVMPWDTVTVDTRMDVFGLEGLHPEDLATVTGRGVDLNVGTYPLRYNLSYPGSANYTIDSASSRLGSVIVSPKALTATLSTPTRTYGDAADLVVTLVGVLPHDQAQSEDVFSNGQTTGISASANSNAVFAGGRTVTYYRQPDGSTAGFVWQLVVVDPNDRRFDRYEPVQVSGPTVANPLNFGVYLNPEQKSLVVPSNASMTAGDHLLHIQLEGAGASNYYVPAPVMLHVDPKSITWSVASNPNGLYGGRTKICAGNECGSVAGISPGAVTFNGLVYGDQLNGAVNLLDGNGVVAPLNQDTPIGSYFEVVGNVTGARSPNYTIATSGNSAGVMTIGKGIINYTTTSGVYIRGFGLLEGTPGGDYTLVGVKPGDQVGLTIALLTAPAGTPGAQIVAVEDLSRIPSGTYYYDAIAFSADASKYVLGTGTRFNSIGTLAVDDSTVFNQTFANPRLESVPPPAPDQQAARVPLDELMAALLAPSAEGFQPINTTGGTGTQTNSGVTQTSTGLIAGAGAGAGANTSTTVGDVEMSAKADATTQALARFGVTGVVVGTGAGAGGAVRLEVEGGYVEIGADASAKAVAKVSLGILNPSLQLSVAARLGEYKEVGLEGGLADGLSGSLAVRQDMYLLARSDQTFGLNDGMVTVRASAFVGGGLSWGVMTGLSGDFGSANAGATVYTPGSLYGDFDPSAGYQDGELKVRLGIGAALGIGGVNFDLSATVNVGSVENILTGALDSTTGAWDATSDFFSGAFGSRSYCDGPQCAWHYQTLQAATNDPVARLNDLSSAISDYLGTYRGGSRNQDFDPVIDWYNDYKKADGAMNNAIKDQQALVAKFVKEPATFTVADYHALKGSQANIDSKIGTMNSIIGRYGYKVAVTPSGSSASIAYVK